jgi:hypothetical protein
MAAAVCSAPLIPVKKKTDDLVTDELVDDAVVVEDGLGRELVEAVEKGSELM